MGKVGAEVVDARVGKHALEGACLLLEATAVLIDGINFGIGPDEIGDNYNYRPLTARFYKAGFFEV